MFTPMKPIEHLLLALGVLAAILSVGMYYHLTLQRQVRTQQAEVETLRTELSKLMKDPRMPEIERLRASIYAAFRAREQQAVIQKVRKFTRLDLSLARLTVVCKDGQALLDRLRTARFEGQEFEAALGPNGEVWVKFE